MIKTLIGTVGGVGTSTIARMWAIESSGLLLEAANRTRIQDLMLQKEIDHIYDYYDLLTGTEIDTVAIKLEEYDLVLGNIFHDLSEIDRDCFKEIITSLPYDDVIVDLSRHREEDIIYWAEVSDMFYIVANRETGSIRAYERIRYILQKHRLRVPVQLIFNRMRRGDADKLKNENILDEEILQSAYLIEESDRADFNLQEDKKLIEMRNKKRHFWDIFKT